MIQNVLVKVTMSTLVLVIYCVYIILTVIMIMTSSNPICSRCALLEFLVQSEEAIILILQLLENPSSRDISGFWVVVIVGSILN